MTGICLHFEDLTLGYDSHPAVHHLTGNMEYGSMTAVVGANGSGKSTLIKEIAGVIKPISGRCESRCQRLAYLPQQSEIDRSFPAHVIDLISLGFWQRRGLLGRITAEDKADLERCLDAVGHRLHTWPDDDRSTRVVLIGQDMPQKPIRDLFNVLAPRASRRRSAPA